MLRWPTAVAWHDTLFVAANLFAIDAAGNSLFITESDDAGERWGTPRLVADAARGAATMPVLVLSADGALDLSWSQNTTRGLRPDVIRHWHRSPE